MAALPAGWKAERMTYRSGARMRFTSPGGRCFDSLRSVQEYLAGRPARTHSRVVVRIADELREREEEEAAAELPLPAASSSQRASSVRRVTSLGEALRRVRAAGSLLAEAARGSPERAEAERLVSAAKTAKTTRRLVGCELDRVWRIENAALRRQWQPEKEEEEEEEEVVVGFHGAPVANLLGIAQEGFRPATSYRSGTGAFEMLGRFCYFAETPSNALLYSDDFCFVLAARVRLGRVFWTEKRDSELTEERLAALGFDTARSKTVSKRGAIIVAPPSRVLPTHLLMFRKVRSSALWSAVAGPRSHLLPVLPPDSKQDALARAPEGSVVRKSDRFICVVSKTPMFVVHLVVCPLTKVYWDNLRLPADRDLLHKFDLFARGVATRYGGLRILYPVNPSQWLFHCHIVSWKQPQKEWARRGKLVTKFGTMLQFDEFVDMIRHNDHLGYAGDPTTDQGPVPIPIEDEEEESDEEVIVELQQGGAEDLTATSSFAPPSSSALLGPEYWRLDDDGGVIDAMPSAPCGDYWTITDEDDEEVVEVVSSSEDEAE